MMMISHLDINLHSVNQKALNLILSHYFFAFSLVDAIHLKFAVDSHSVEMLHLSWTTRLPLLMNVQLQKFLPRKVMSWISQPTNICQVMILSQQITIKATSDPPLDLNHQELNLNALNNLTSNHTNHSQAIKDLNTMKHQLWFQLDALLPLTAPTFNIAPLQASFQSLQLAWHPIKKCSAFH